MSVRTQESALRIALVFPGQGAQHPRMAAGLYGHEAVFTAAMDEALELLGADGERIRSAWLARTTTADFDDVTVSQPLLYAVDHALGRMVLDWGVEPVALMGHSVGELVAATLAGVVGFADGIRLMRARIRQFAQTPAGGMLAVAAGLGEVEDLLTGQVHLAAVNARRQLLLAGEREPLDRAAQALRERGIVCRDARARQAFHSPVVDEAVEASMPDWLATPLNRPRRTVYSAYTQGVLTDDTALDHRFWARQAAETVHFAPTLDRLLADHDCLLVEAGPGNSLSTVARRHPAVVRGGSEVAPLLPDGAQDDVRDRRSVAAAKERILPLQQPVRA
ncbi:acyltransferase domain-containing protein [Streptomyces canus]|uniref:acyltransferase domain-containing protein n=1 Tax=Streptomyces canus TaxID=58343 RepID=UPI002E2D556F|nr:acyltransferase domain-containing protein [Streptomyces canus]